MTDLNKTPVENLKIYPSLIKSENNVNRKEFMLYVVDEHMKRLNKHIVTTENKVEKLRKTSNILSYSSTCFNALGVSSTSAGFATALSGLGIIVSVPLGIVAATSGFVGGVFCAINSKLSKKMLKKLTQLKNVYDVRTRLHLLYARSINDGVLNENEFRNLMGLMTEFESIIMSKYELAKEDNLKNNNVR